MRRDRPPVTGPAAWFVRFAALQHDLPAGLRRLYRPLDIQRRSRERAHLRLGDEAVRSCLGQPYGIAPLEQTAARATVLLLLAAFLAACAVQLAGGILLILLRPAGFAVLPAGMLLSAIFWWGFDLPLAWLTTATLLPILAAAWLVYRKASRNSSGPQRPPVNPALVPI